MQIVKIDRTRSGYHWFNVIISNHHLVTVRSKVDPSNRFTDECYPVDNGSTLHLVELGQVSWVKLTDPIMATKDDFVAPQYVRQRFDGSCCSPVAVNIHRRWWYLWRI